MVRAGDGIFVNAEQRTEYASDDVWMRIGAAPRGEADERVLFNPLL